MLRVLALNIWNLGGDWRARRQAILSVIRDCEADVVCLQEVVEAGGKNQAKWLAGEVSGWSWTWAGEAGYGVPCRAVWTDVPRGPAHPSTRLPVAGRRSAGGGGPPGLVSADGG